MQTMTVKASDLVSIHKMHRAALGYGMFYRKPYSANGKIDGAEGTVYTVFESTLVACIMATRNRMIIHARIPCANVDNHNGALFAFTSPKDFDRPLRRFREKPLILKLTGSRLEIVLPRPGNAKGLVWLPLQRVKGQMLSAYCAEPTTTVNLNADILIAAMKRVPRGQPWDILAMQLCDAGADFRYTTNGTITHEWLPAKAVRHDSKATPWVCSARRAAGLARVLNCLPKNGRNVQVQISASEIIIWNDTLTFQIFADRSSEESRRISTPDKGGVTSELKLILRPRPAETPKGTGKWLRQLIRRAGAENEVTETCWILSRKQIVLTLDCGLQTSLEMPCACNDWHLDDELVCLRVDPLATATILECIEEDHEGCQLTYSDSLLTVQAGSRPYKLTVRAVPNKNFQLSDLLTAKDQTTRAAISEVPATKEGE